MEKQAKPPRNNILKFLPRAASAIYFQNLPFSPSKDHRKSHGPKGFSGPIVSIIPDEARRKPRNNDGFGSQEPTSPKISCMGQIKHKKTVKDKAPPRSKKYKRVPPPEKPVLFSPREGKKKSGESAMKRMLSLSKLPGRKSDSGCEKAGNVVDRAPALSQLKAFSSGRETLSGFDWTAEIQKQSCGGRNCYSDDEREEEEEEEEEVIIVPALRPTVTCLKARNEVNLWKRRTVNPPTPIRINPMP